MRWPSVTVATLAAVALGVVPAAAAPPPPPAPAPTPTPTAPAPPTTAPTTPTVPAGPPSLDSLRLPRTVAAQQGHARFLVGIRLATPARLTLQVIRPEDERVVQTITDRQARAAGRAYIRVEATDGRGFQLPAGAYRIRIQATDAQGRTSPARKGNFTLQLTPPRALLDAYVVPVLKPFRRELRGRARGQLIAAVAPGGVLVKAGVRRGDLITAIDGTRVARAGAFASVLRRLPTEQNVTLSLVRAGRPFQAVVQLQPDWQPQADYAKSLTVIARRSPNSIATAYARARQQIDADRPAQAAALLKAWPRSWRLSSVGQLVAGDIGTARGRWKGALGSYNRARSLDPSLGPAELGRGTALSELGRNQAAIDAFQAAVRLAPADPAAYAFQAYALLRADRTAEAVTVAREAVRLDTNYAEGHLALGIAVIQTGDVARGRTALRRGLILLDDAARAGRLIEQNLNPTDP